MSDAATQTVINLSTPLLVGTLLNCGLAGWTSSLAATYYNRFPADPKPIKIIVGVLAFLDVCYTVLSCWLPYDWLVRRYGDVEYPLGAWYTFSGNDLITGLVTVIVQTFFAWRIYLLSGRKLILPIFITFCGVLSCGFGIATGVMGWKLVYVYRFNEFNWGISIWLIAAAVGDLAITGSLFFWLKSDTGHQETSFIVKRVLVQSLETNCITATVAIVDIILFLAIPSSSYHILFNCLLAKLYNLSLLVSLNSRTAIANSLRKMRQNSSDPVITFPGPKRPAATNNVRVQVDTAEAIYSGKDELFRAKHKPGLEVTDSFPVQAVSYAEQRKDTDDLIAAMNRSMSRPVETRSTRAQFNPKRVDVDGF